MWNKGLNFKENVIIKNGPAAFAVRATGLDSVAIPPSCSVFQFTVSPKFLVICVTSFQYFVTSDGIFHISTGLNPCVDMKKQTAGDEWSILSVTYKTGQSDVYTTVALSMT